MFAFSIFRSHLPSIQFPCNWSMECSDILSLKSKTEFKSFELGFFCVRVYVCMWLRFPFINRLAIHSEMYTLRMESGTARLTAFQDFHMKFLFAYCATTRNSFIFFLLLSLFVSFRWHQIHVWPSKSNEGLTTYTQKIGAANGRNESNADL